MMLLPPWLSIYLGIGLLLLLIGVRGAVEPPPPALERIAGRPVLTAIAIVVIIIATMVAWPLCLLGAWRRRARRPT